MREEPERTGTHGGVLTGLSGTGGVTTSPGTVLVGTFSMLGILSSVALTEIRFIVAFGVMLDTFVVSPTQVPSLTLDPGRNIWWPSPLSSRQEERSIADKNVRAVVETASR